jgi:hypothetical protein
VELINNKLWTNDFKVYFEASIDYFKGKNPYIHSYGLDSGFFKYPPFTLYIFRLFSFLNYNVSQFIHLFLLMTSLIVSIITLKELSPKTVKFNYKSPQNWLLFVPFLIVAIHLVREIHMGNINLYLLVLFVLGIKNIQNKKDFNTAIFWSFMLILKPIMILSVIPLLFYKKFRIILYMMGFGLFFFIFPIIDNGWEGNLTLWGNWFTSVSNHGDYIISENSLTYLTNFYLGYQSNWIPSLICLAILVSILIYQIFKNKTSDNDLINWAVVLTGFSPNFFVTDTEHFLLIIPTVVFTLYYLSKTKSLFGWISFSLGILLFSFNSNDLLGRELSDKFDAYGILGIANMIFIITFLWQIRISNLTPLKDKKS